MVLFKAAEWVFIMYFLFIKLLSLSVLALPGVSCISVSLKSIRDKPARGVKYVSPPSPYQLVAGDEKDEVSSGANRADATWVDESNRNKISFYSNCASSVHVNSLRQLEKDLLEGISQEVKNKDSTRVHQGVPARFLQMEVEKLPGPCVSLWKCFSLRKKNASMF